MSQPTGSQTEVLKNYQQNIHVNESAIQKLKQNKGVLAIARLITVFGGAGICWYFWPASWIVFFAIFLFSTIFIFLVFRDADKLAAIKNRERLILVNRHEVDAIHQTLQAYDDGQSFADPAHAYASDLDLFGPASLFQWLSRCRAEQSKKLLADLLKSPLPASAIKDRQTAIKELSDKQESCQQFQSIAMANPLSFKTEKRLKQWVAQDSDDFEKPLWRWLRHIYPVFTLTILALYMTDNISTGVFLFYLIAFVAFSFFISKKINPVYTLLSLIQPEMDSLHEQLHLVEKENYKSAFLLALQSRLKPKGYDSASAAMRDFHSILKKFDFRLNIVVFIFLNGFLLWDLRQMLALNVWKKKNQIQLSESFEIIAEMEVSISMASLVHNEPEWCFPDVDEKYFHFEAKEIGHPLIPAATRVTSDFSLEGTGKIALITGSNMAGKSTFLRSLGTNTVLAGMGCPVCARHMNLSTVKLMSSMRVADNLAENTSTFYAELKKLQFIIESVDRKEKVFILLDEVLRGTNSSDRHKGSKALLRQLLQSGAVAVMATHDTGLAHSEGANPSVFNYHFDGRIQEEELYFDYKIKKGISESLNATALMKKIGIHFQD